ncbi:MAG: hypothetical protein WCW44_01315 [archaeon]|jgi:hypothetical protein
MSKNKISNNKLIGIIMLIALVLPYIPVVNALAPIGTLALFLIAIYLLVKG